MFFQWRSIEEYPIRNIDSVVLCKVSNGYNLLQSRNKRGAALTKIYYTEIESPIGPLFLTMESDHLTNVCMSQQKRSVEVQPDWILNNRPFLAIAKQFAEFFRGKRREFNVPLRMRGTDFQRSVWDELRKIPYGTTTTYGEIAKRIRNPKAVRAVGLANGQNPIPIIVPCHRVIGSNGKLTGFGGGLENKAFLLQLEQQS
jgi:methylated-DNA-[protein]-cysteine S-methyltransferase